MDKKLQILQAKELRKIIIEKLYEFYGDEINLNTIKTLLKYKGRYADKEIKNAIRYLSGEENKYVLVKNDSEEYWDRTVELTPLGINLAEGDKKDVGMLNDE